MITHIENAGEKRAGAMRAMPRDALIRKVNMNDFDVENDDRDGILFRFWIRAASYPGGWPGRLSELFHEHGPKGKENMQPRHYRAALMVLAEEKGINLP